MNLGSYQILNKLGEGAFGVVYKARDKKNNTICVIKKIDTSKMSPKLRKNAMEEGKILKQLKSPYIVKHFQSFLDKNTLNIVMQYCPKGDLTNFMKAQLGKPLKEDRIWQISIQMMIGLRDLHAKKILHRDIKSLNIFLDAEGNIRIGDLGVAKSMKTDFAYTIVGTPYYLSPEMCQQKPYNEKTDIWAMGCIIYQLCTGKHPFQANNQAALALKIVMGKYESIPDRYSSDLAWVVRSCLSVDYKRRPTTLNILSKQNIIEKAKQLGIAIDYNSEKMEEIKQIAVIIQTVQKQQVNKQEKNKPNVIKIPPPTPRKNNSVQNTPQLAKKFASGPQPRKSTEKKVEIQRNQKHKSYEIPKSRMPPKKDIQVNIDNKAKRYSGAKLQQIKVQEKIRQNKSTFESMKTQNRNQKGQSKEKLPKNGNIQKIEHQYCSVKVNQNEKIQPNLNMTMNRFLPDQVRQKRQFDYEDQIANNQKVQIPDSSSDSSEQKVKIKQQKIITKNKTIFQNAQQSVDDDDLMEEFGIPPSKKIQIQNFVEVKLENKVKQINWDLIDQEPHIQDKQIIKNNFTYIQKNESFYKQQNLPTIKTSSYLEREPLVEMKFQEQDGQGSPWDEENLLEQECEEIVVQEEIQQNQPYISDEDEEQEHKKTKPISVKDNKSQIVHIVDIPEKHLKLQRKLGENKKRQKQLEKMKGHFQGELLKIIPNRDQYENIKQQLINCSGNDDAVQKFVNKWNGNIQSINLFYRIVHFEMELRRCQQNIEMIENNLNQLNKSGGSH